MLSKAAASVGAQVIVSEMDFDAIGAAAEGLESFAETLEEIIGLLEAYLTARRRRIMRFDRMCNGCGVEFSLDTSREELDTNRAKCPSCGSTDLIPIVTKADEYQSWTEEG